MSTTLRNASIESDYSAASLGSHGDFSSHFSSSPPAFDNNSQYHQFDENDAGEGPSNFDALLPNTPPQSDNDERVRRLSTTEENEGDKPAKKKRKSWGQELPIPKTNLPPRYFSMRLEYVD